MTSIRAYARKTTTATKVYMHAGCTCTRMNGSLVREVSTVAEAEAYAEAQGFTAVFCKTSVPPVEETPAPAVEIEEPAEELVEAPAEEHTLAPELQEQEPVTGHTFEVEASNRDRLFGANRRTVIEAVATALGGTTTYRSVKNATKTGNDAFMVTVTGPAHLEETITTWAAIMEAALVDVIAKAKEDAKAMENATAADKAKAWKTAARDFITESGQELVKRMAG